MGPPTGPVHLDLHLDEPLTGAALPGDVPGELPKDDPIAVFGRPDGRPFAEWAPAELRASGAALDRIGRLVREQAAGVIVVGPLDASDEEATAIPFLADALRVPVLADPLSGLRRPAHGAMELITTCDAALRSDRVAAELRPAWILRIGRLPTSGPLVQWMARHGSAELVVVDDQGRWEDPNHTGALFVRARAAAFCGVLGTAVRGRLGDQPARSRWLDRWRRLEEACAVSLDCAPAGQLLEDSLVRLLTDAAPSGTVLHVASSMPVRELDSFLRPGAGSLRVLASRGVNGIDGQVSTALGVAAAGVGPTWALLGDLSTLHDLGGLAAAARLGLDATLVVVNNGGGAIFEYLPLADTEARLDELFVASHDLRFEQAAAMYGLEYLAPENEDALLDALARPASGVRLIELAVDRQASVAWHRELWTRASAAAEAALGDTR